jgi:hypothetical protein
MTRRVLSEVSEGVPDLPCDFKHSENCQRPATTYVEWDVDGFRERTFYCDDHAARELEQYAEPSAEELARDELEALTDPFDEAVLRDQEAEGQPVERLWYERSEALAELRSAPVPGPEVEAGDPDQSVLEAACAALDRHSAGLWATATAVPPDAAVDYARLAGAAAAHAETLRALDPSEHLDERQMEALHAGLDALHADVDGWNRLAEVASSSGWRLEFDTRAREALQVWKRAEAFQQQLSQRDRGAEQEAER